MKDERQTRYFMAGEDAVDEADRAVLSNRTLLVLVWLFAILCVLSFWGMTSLTENLRTTVMMPPYDGTNDMEVGLTEADDKYYTLWGEYLTKRAANFDPDNIEQRLFDATSIMKRSLYLQNSTNFKKFILSMKTNQVRQSFETTLGVNESKIKKMKNGQVEFVQHGTATQKIGKTTVLKKDCDYTVVLYMEGGKIYEEGLKTNCFDSNTSELSQ